MCGDSCVICGWSKKRNGILLVEGAHIKPLEYDADCDNRFNIIALCPNHHTMFDNYLFYIEPQTLIVKFQDKTDEFNNLDLSQKLKYIKKEYLAYRKYLYEVNNQALQLI